MPLKVLTSTISYHQSDPHDQGSCQVEFMTYRLLIIYVSHLLVIHLTNFFTNNQRRKERFKIRSLDFYLVNQYS